MHNDNFPYHSLHDFLEQRNILNSSEANIKKAKKEYERLYQQHYRKGYKKQQLNLILSKSTFLKLKEKAQENQTIPTKYVRLLILDTLCGNSTGMSTHQLIEIENQLLAMCDTLDALKKEFPLAQHLFSELIQTLESILIKLSN